MNAFVPLSLMRVGRIEDLPRRGARVVRVGRLEIAVFRTVEDRVFALENRCPHRGGPLAEGIVHDHAVTCPLHNWVIDLATGRARGADEGCVATVPVTVAPDGALLLDPATLPRRREREVA